MAESLAQYSLYTRFIHRVQHEDVSLRNCTTAKSSGPSLDRLNCSPWTRIQARKLYRHHQTHIRRRDNVLYQLACRGQLPTGTMLSLVPCVLRSSWAAGPLRYSVCEVFVSFRTVTTRRPFPLYSVTCDWSWRRRTAQTTKVELDREGVAASNTISCIGSFGL